MRSRSEIIGTGKAFLNIAPLVQAIRPTINDWDLTKLRGFYIAKDTHSFRQGSNLQNGKRFLSTTHPMES